jgi:hypothetical protein
MTVPKFTAEASLGPASRNYLVSAWYGHLAGLSGTSGGIAPSQFEEMDISDEGMGEDAQNSGEGEEYVLPENGEDMEDTGESGDDMQDDGEAEET